MHKVFAVLETLLRVHFGRLHSRNLKLLEETGVGVRETTPETPAEGGQQAPTVADYDSIANGDLWDLLFMVTDGTARDLVMECDQDGRRALLRLRYEYRQGESARSVDHLEDLLAGAKIVGEEYPGDQLRDIVAAHRSLQAVQPYRTEAMLQRVILRAIDTGAYHVLQMDLKAQMREGATSTTSICNQVEQYWVDAKGRSDTAPGQDKARALGAVAGSFPCYRQCDVCQEGAHWIRDCPLILEAKGLRGKSKGRAAVATFWEEVEDGTEL